MPKKNGIITNKTPQTNGSTSSASGSTLPEKDSITVDSTVDSTLTSPIKRAGSSLQTTPTKRYH